MIINGTKFIILKSNIAGETPTIPSVADHRTPGWIAATDIYEGELFYNTVDKKLYTRTGNDITLLASEFSYGNLSTLSDVNITSSLNNLDVLTYDSSSSKWTNKQVLDGILKVNTSKRSLLQEGCSANGNNSVALGSSTTASGYYSTALGSSTTASGNYALSEGLQTVASSTAAHAEGYQTNAMNLYTHAEGFQSVAHLRGQYAKSSTGKLSGANITQYSNITIAAKTTDATPKKLTLDGNSIDITIPTNIIWTGRAMVTAADADGNVNYWNCDFGVKNVKGTVSQVTLPTISDRANQISGISLSINVDNTFKTLNFVATGKANTTIYWTAFVEMNEHQFNIS